MLVIVDSVPKMDVLALALTFGLFSAGISRRRMCVCLSVTHRHCVKTARRRITQTTSRYSPGTLSFLAPTVVGGRRIIPADICAQSDPPPSENADFDRFRLIVPQLRELAKKSLIIVNRKSTTRFPSSHR